MDYYEDPEEPDDFGNCENSKHPEDCTHEDETCKHFEESVNAPE